MYFKEDIMWDMTSSDQEDIRYEQMKRRRALAEQQRKLIENYDVVVASLGSNDAREAMNHLF